jgi:hypothetical protein
MTTVQLTIKSGNGNPSQIVPAAIDCLEKLEIFQSYSIQLQRI